MKAGISKNLALAATACATVAASAPPVAQLRWKRRVLIIATPSAEDPRFERQRRALSGWSKGAGDRDVTVIDVVGDQIIGSSDTADDLRRKHHLPADRFMVVLIGKDGHEALRSPQPLENRTLAAAIDAMPMRQAGRR